VPAISINLIKVGSEQFTAADNTTINNAVTVLRNTYSSVGVSLRRVENWFITNVQANGRDILDDNGEAETLTDEWTVPNNNVDVFLVKLFVGSVAGLSPVGGPCDKDAKGMDGMVVELIGSMTGLALAHELGHYLGLSHVSDSTNLMFPSAPNGGQLTAAQGATMKSHCFIEA